MTAAAESDRLHALDAVRGFALTLGVFFHATMSYLPGPPIWPIQDADPSPAMGATFFVLHIFRMSLFFLIAGFFGRMLLHRRGTAGFVRDRLRRIGIPLVGFWPISIASIVAVSVFAWVSTHPGVAPPPTPTAPPVGPGVFFPLTHLWFLYVLLWLYALALLVRAPIAALDRDGRFRRGVDACVTHLVRNPLGVIVLAAPFLAALWFAPAWMMWFGIPPADTNLVVNPQALAAFGTAFGFGWLLQRQVDLLQVIARRWALHLAAALALTVACLWIAGPQPILKPAARTAETYAFAVCYGLAIWTWSFALLGLALTFLSGHSPARRYLADASYWIYLVHLPLVMFFQALADLIAWPWWVEYPLILVAAFPIMLGSYELFVRYSWIGAILNGRRFPRPARSPAKPALQGA
ncbi:acyltransferase family protein [Phenylobacterium terrae]|uniref:Acyltransferase family protein n=1 Tax=Phenylobacterium terrae TaxID=2665495 RepID=A0ABW4N761_9CAUL